MSRKDNSYRVVAIPFICLIPVLLAVPAFYHRGNRCAAEVNAADALPSAFIDKVISAEEYSKLYSRAPVEEIFCQVCGR